MFQNMQQIQLSPVKFTKEEISQQQQELNSKISLLLNTVAIDEITVLFFGLDSDPDIEPQEEFRSIIKNSIPPVKANQIRTIERLAFCFYSMLVEGKQENLDCIQVCYKKYLERTTYTSVVVDFHQKIRKWCKQLAFTKDLAKSKQNLLTIADQIKQNQQKRLQILVWKINVCAILFEIISQKNKIERNQIIKLLKTFKNLKKENKISTKPILAAFKYMIKYFISTNNDLYIFFERQIKIWCQQIVDNNLISEMKNIILECEKISAESFKQNSNLINQQKIILPKKNNQSKERKIVMNTLRPHMFYQSNPALISGRRLIRRRPSRQKEDNFQQKINHFLKTRANNFLPSSQTATPRRQVNSNLKISIKMSEKPSLSLHSISRFTLEQTLINTKKARRSNADDKKSETELKEASRISLSASKSASSFYRKKGTRKRQQIYQKLVQNEGSRKLITNKHLKDEMFSLYEVEEQRCKITLQEVLIGEFKKTESDPNIKFIGVSEDNEFQNLSLSFFTIFNQELAQIHFTLEKGSKQDYILKCQTKSTYCNNPTIFEVEKNQITLQQFTFDELNDNLINSVIYYEALQEKVERKISVAELQAMQEFLRSFLGVQLSQSQLTKLLIIVDLFESFFFWYYTKGNYVNGCRLEKRTNIDFRDLSAFAVSLGKFKSDYDSCLSQIVLVENTKSLLQTCIYLSYGRKIVYKAMRKIKDVFYLEVITISDRVYQSFSRKGRKPYFQNTQLKRNLLKVNHFTTMLTYSDNNYESESRQLQEKIDLRQVLDQQDVFIFFMKNIVQNFIEIKHLRKIQEHLLEINFQENFELFDEKNIKPYQRHNLDIITNSEQIYEVKEYRPFFHSEIRHLKDILLKYCEVYGLNPTFSIVKKRHHFIYLQNITYIANQIQLINELKIVFICKKGKRQHYSLFMYHQTPDQLAIINTSFHKRFVMRYNKMLVGNLIRRQKAQMYLSDDCSAVTKEIVKYGNSYCYISVSQCQSILCWRLDFYFPQCQGHYSTFLDEQIYLECLDECKDSQQMWKQTIKQIKISIQEQCIKLHEKKISIFKSIKRLTFDQNSAKGVLELIQLSGQLLFLVTNFEAGTMSIGKVQSIMFLNNKSFFSLMASAKEQVRMYDNIMNHLYYKILTGKLPSEQINADYFMKEDDD